MRLSAVQFKARKDDPEGSLRRLAELAADAATRSDLVVLPEMAATGYVFPGPDAVRAVAETPDGPTFQALSPIARASACWLVCGFPERAGDRLFNSALVIDPSGARAFTYRKTLLFEADLPWATPGDSGYRSFDGAEGCFGVGICMDLNDDRFLAWCGAAGVDVLALPTNWIDEGVSTWPYWAWRMSSVSATLVAANTYGSEGDTRFSGCSAILAGRTVLAAAPATGDGTISATLPGARAAPPALPDAV